MSETHIPDVTVDDVEPAEAVDDQAGEFADLAELPDLEAPEADVVEQHQTVRPDGPRFELDHVLLDADEADVAEQSQDVGPDEDDYR